MQLFSLQLVSSEGSLSSHVLLFKTELNGSVIFAILFKYFSWRQQMKAFNIFFYEQWIQAQFYTRIMHKKYLNIKFKGGLTTFFMQLSKIGKTCVK